MKRASFVIAALAALAWLTGAPAQAQQDNTRDFVMKVAHGSLAEVELGQLASQRAQDPAVKQFGQRMVTEHGQAYEELTQLAQSKGMSLPTALSATHAALRDRLASLSGADFDRAYMDEMLKDHVKDVAEFERASQRLEDSDARAWAGKTVPVLRDHLAQARSLHAQVAGTPGAVAASPATVTTTTTTTVSAPAAAAPAAAWCGGTWMPGAGTNFGNCPGVSAPKF